MRILLVPIIVLAVSAVARAEDFHFELTASYWPLSPSGSVHTNSTDVDLRSDLGIQGRKGHGAFKFVVKPGARHRFNVEVIPYRLNGANMLTRTFQLGGNTYTVRDRIESEGNVDYVFGGYQYDVVNNGWGHAGIGGGVAYVGTTTSATSQTFGFVGTEERQVPLPLASGEFRVFPIPATQVFNLNGEVKGMAFGSYGSYIQAAGHAGIAVARFARLQAGFMLVDADVHERDRARRIVLRFAGPIFSVQLHD